MTKIRRLLVLVICLGLASLAGAESIRVHVYKLSQQYWDVRPGDTLSGIVDSLLPAGDDKQQQLMRDIVELNPGAFLDGDPDRLRANVRLWLPNAVQTPVKPLTGEHVTVERFKWGSIKRVRP